MAFVPLNLIGMFPPVIPMLISRPVYSHSYFENNSIVSNPFRFSGLQPIVLLNKDLHFVAGLRLNPLGVISVPTCSQLTFWVNEAYPTYISYE